uniref:FAM161 centrosomal protein A n=1 Tax=Sphenodon punctatus TaxID=8508 RepID=A0A8D0H127_SPHPU
METAHRAALLAASCLSTPLNPRTRAPAARYEREEPPRLVREAASGVCLGAVMRETRGGALNPSVRGLSDPAPLSYWMDFSKMYHSNQEYYLKLEELKNAHLETMTKLEHMYQNKLYLRGVQPLVSKEYPLTSSSRFIMK